MCHKNDIFEEIIMNKVANLAGRFTKKILSKKKKIVSYIFSERGSENAVWIFIV